MNDGVFLNLSGDASGRHELVCRQCQCSIELIGSEENPEAVRCPSCGNGSDFQKAAEEALAAVVEDQIADEFSSVARSSKGLITVSKKPGNVPDFVLRD